ncbi:hypothetical protein [Erythrobacter sp. R86502]|uniref:hypothetical protein n=1 Tax=Erythrobacter sp. R86502 TaxID=3093846 RepID=UPI0036D29139
MNPVYHPSLSSISTREDTATRRRSGVGFATLLAGGALLSACATPAPPPPPPPPPPAAVVESVPYRPLPPGGAHYVMDLPPRGPDGRRVTVNSNLSDDQLVWNLRSAWNVAALNCLSSEYEPILDGYRAFLTSNVKSLKAVNDRIEKSYTSRFRVRRDAMVARDGYTTQVYNFFAEPAARAGFCRAALDMANRSLAAPSTDLVDFSRTNFDGLMAPFEQFFNEYEAYQQASAAWDARWGTLFGASQPGWVAVQQARAGGMTVPTVTTQTVTDPETGLQVPVIPVNEGVVSQPIVEPIAAQPEAVSGQ